MRCGVCQKALEHADQGFWCGSCFKIKYCSVDCEVQHAPHHQTLCALVEQLRAELPGFNHRLFLRHGTDTGALLPTHDLYQQVYQLGHRQLTAVPGGALVYTTHAPGKLDALRARARPHELVLWDPCQQLALHVWVMNRSQLKALLRPWPRAPRQLFLTLCQRPQLVTTLGVPVVYLRDFWQHGEHERCLSTFLIAPTEL